MVRFLLVSFRDVSFKRAGGLIAARREQVRLLHADQPGYLRRPALRGEEGETFALADKTFV